MLLSLTTSCGKDEEEQNSEQGASVAPIIVTVDANGNADGGHRFVIIDETSFYIDDIKYTATKGDLIVSGYNNAFFKGEAKIISQLNYVGREMHVKAIESDAFWGCIGLTSVTIPSSVTRIGTSAFQNCTSLTSVTIPSSITRIGSQAFSYCTSLTEIVVTNENPTYDSRNNCNAIIETATNTLIAGCNNTTIPNNVTSIGNYAFSGRSGLTSITIPESVTTIGTNAFGDCIGLTSVTIPSSVTRILMSAFQKCTSLTTVTIGKNVTSIGERAFYDADISTIISLIEEPFAISGLYGGREFSEYTFRYATLYVPHGTIDKYRATKGWKDFANIVEGNPSDVQ